MPRPRFAILPLFALLTATTGVKAVDRDKLRQAASLPVVSVFGKFYFYHRGFSLHDWKEVPLAKQIADVRKALKGDATDAERYRHLGNLYTHTNQPSEAKEAFAKAADLCRRQIREGTQDITCRLRLAQVLQDMEQVTEAEMLLRQAVKEAPRDWHGWLELAQFLDGEWLFAIMGSRRWRYNGPDAILEAMRTAQPTEGKITAARKYREEADACYERAITLAPREAGIYRARAASRSTSALVDNGLRRRKDDKADFFAAFLSPPFLADLRRAVELRPDDYVGIGTIISFEITAERYQYHLQHPDAKPPTNIRDVLSESTRDRLRKDLARLAQGMTDPDRGKAADAAEALGYLQVIFLQDGAGAEKALRRCVELDITRDNAWDMLIVCLGKKGRFQEAADLGRRRLKYKDSAHNRLVLAKIYDGLRERAKAVEEVRAGLKRDPDDFLLRLALADLLLMSGEEKELAEAGQILYKMQKDQFSAEGNENRLVNYVFTCGIYFGLIGESKRAEEWLVNLQKRQPDYQGLKEALEALGDPITAPSQP